MPSHHPQSRRHGLTTSLLTMLALSSSATTAKVIENLSFGHIPNQPLSPNLRAIPNFHLSSTGHTPQILSDRIILTPPHPGSARGAIWSDTTLLHHHTAPSFTAELAFRAGGNDRGSGNLQVWYTSDGQKSVGQNSIYTVGRFDGLALVVDMHGGRGGQIRGFLNDGTIDFGRHQGVDGLAFGRCDYAYRNRGAWSEVKLIGGEEGIQVWVDGEHCFGTARARLPLGYYFGISAASAEVPDSFEVHRFRVEVPDGPGEKQAEAHQVKNEQQQGQGQQAQGQQDNKGYYQQVKPPPPVEYEKFTPMEDASAGQFKDANAQFADLHNRLQVVNHQVNNIFKELRALSNNQQNRHKELVEQAVVHPGQVHGLQQSMEHRFSKIEESLERIRMDVEGKDYRSHIEDLRRGVEETRTSLMEGFEDRLSGIMHRHAPKLGTMVFVIIAFQVMLAGAYIVYKKRRANAPKKYL